MWPPAHLWRDISHHISDTGTDGTVRRPSRPIGSDSDVQERITLLSSEPEHFADLQGGKRNVEQSRNIYTDIFAVGAFILLTLAVRLLHQSPTTQNTSFQSSRMAAELPNFEITNCFPSMACLSGNAPDECQKSNIICPALPVSPVDSRVTFSPSGVHSNAVTSSDSEDSINGKPAISEKTSNQPNPARPTRPHRRVPHTVIERRYRDNLNTQIETLRLSLPSLKNAYVTSPDVEDSALPPRLPSKAMIIATASTYIKELEAERNQAVDVVNSLQQQVADLQKLVQCNDCSILQYLQEASGSQPQLSV